MKSIEHLTLHVGVHKTGSSLIQRSLRGSRMSLRAHGIAYVDRREFLAMPDFRAWAAYDRSKYSKEAFFGQLESAVTDEQRKTLRGGRRVLISNESIPGRVQPDYPNPFWPRARSSIEELLRVLEPERTSVILYVRRQDRLLESLYMQRIHDGHSTPWKKFKAMTMGDDRVDFNRLVDSIDEVVGVEDITVRPFEVIGAGGEAFLADFWELAGLDGVATPRAGGVSNPSYTAPAWKAALVLNRYVDDPNDIRAVKEFLNGMFPPGQFPKARLLSDAQRQALISRYRSLNEALFLKRMPDFPVESYSSQEATDALVSYLSSRQDGEEATSRPQPKRIEPPRVDESGPTIAQIRAISQPPEILERRSEEHWTGKYMRRISPHVTLRAVRFGIRPNLITALMVLVGVLGVALAAVPGVWSALGAVFLIQVYLLLDCVDGETARYTRQTSPKGVYLDRLGHYLVEGGLMVALGLRAASGEMIWVIVGLVAAIFVILEKVETDLVAVARLGSGLGKVDSGSDVPRSAGVAGLRRSAQRVPIHLATHAAEASLLIFISAVVDGVIANGPEFSRGLLVAMAAISGVMVLAHLFSILQSRRLER